MSTNLEEKGDEFAGEPKYCEVCDDKAYKYITYLGTEGYICYDCYDLWLSSYYEEESKL